MPTAEQLQLKKGDIVIVVFPYRPNGNIVEIQPHEFAQDIDVAEVQILQTGKRGTDMRVLASDTTNQDLTSYARRHYEAHWYVGAKNWLPPNFWSYVVEGEPEMSGRLSKGGIQIFRGNDSEGKRIIKVIHEQKGHAEERSL